MSFRATTTAFAIALGTFAMSGATASAASGSSPQIRAVYRSVLTAEYVGPASAVCSRLTASGVNSFTAGGQGTYQKIERGHTSPEWATVRRIAQALDVGLSWPKPS
jgi:hypothetical protein